ncbi:GDNF family receptor alpha-3 isoform X5 [Ailuropoda melanoleuca]|uniref:GDNF family receptor alpha-3 isoform X5 n=1 Tax=Ailuropoda melanoleuca TaxID=9646 RepID=UPI0014944915|nr:GDNF family receptor alpha-3 isoform X5 [Ailuropoda melanoleuca]
MGGGGRGAPLAEPRREERGERGTRRWHSVSEADGRRADRAMASPPNSRTLQPVLLLLLLVALPLGADPLPTEGRLVNSCIQARRKCQVDPICSAAYHHLNSCTSSVSTPSPAQELLVPEECREAAQHLRNSSLMSCTCHRRMKNQVACLDIYWTVHLARSLGDFELDVSPYEDAVTRKPWKMNLSKLNMLKPDSDLCLKFAMLCTLNDKCDRLRKAYGEACSGSHCQRHTCLRQLRAFFEKASEPHAQGLLLCPCAPADQGCGQRRRNTIAPSCALPPGAPNCLELRRVSRLVDFQTHCHPLDILGTCATEHSRCLRAYMGLIGTAMTPNFVSNVNTSVALSCTCRGSGNLQDECEQLEESFSHNPCLSECVPPAPSPRGSVSWIQREEKVEAIAAKMRFHSQLFSQDWADSTFSVMERQVGPPLLHTSYLYWTSWGKPREGDRGGDLTVVLNTIDL